LSHPYPPKVVRYCHIALVGALRYSEHRSVPEIHRALVARGLAIAERSVTNLLYRYEELVALRLANQGRLAERLREQGQVILALDGRQPDVGHAVLWVLRDCLSGEVLLARSLRGSTEGELVPLLREVAAALPVPIRGVISDGRSRSAMLSARPCRRCRTSCASATPCGRRPSRSSRRIGMPKCCSSRRCAVCAPSNAPLQGATMPRRPRRAGSAWPSAAP